MISAKFYQNFSKIQILVSQAQRTAFSLLIICSKFVPKSIHQIVQFQLQKYKFSSFCEQARSQDWIWGGEEAPKSGPFGPKKWTFWTSTPSTLLQKPNFWPTLWTKVDLLPDLGGCITPPHPLATGLSARGNIRHPRVRKSAIGTDTPPNHSPFRMSKTDLCPCFLCMVKSMWVHIEWL